MTFINFFHGYGEIINTISNLFIAFGTVGAVITALWLSYKNDKPKLKVYATVGIITPEMSKHLWASCTNVGKQSIMCTNFSFNPNKFKNLRIMLTTELKELSAPLPKLTQYSERIDKRYELKCLADPTIAKFLSQYKWLAKIQLKYFWRVIVNTNIKEFEGKLSNSLINEVLSMHF